MAAVYDQKELEHWAARIVEKADEFGLDCYSQEFEICDHNQMLGYMAYSGMPSHYPHWSYGKAFEKLKTLYDHGVSGLPYEMVINSNPAIAYLMRDNSLLLQILTIAHVYAHNDFFKNNFTFSSTRPEHTVSMCKAHAKRLRSYLEDPSLGVEKVEPLVDAAHALAFQCRRNLAVRKRSEEEAKEAAIEAALPKADPFRNIHERPAYDEPDLRRTPLAPDEDLLLFIRDHNPYLTDWERDVLTMVHEEAQYFIPQIETKIMNEGWASYWHKRILDGLRLPHDLRLEFIVRHNQVVQPFPGQINPYHLGLRIWEDLYRRGAGADERDLEPDASLNAEGLRAIFAAREADRDTAFLRRHLTKELIRELDLYQYAKKDEEFVITQVADERGWREVKATLIANVGTNGIPVIRVTDADFGGSRALLLEHVHDGRDLHLEYAEKTLRYVWELWQRDVLLATALDGKMVRLRYGEDGFSKEEVK